MILHWMLYAGAVSLLLGLSARSLEIIAFRRGWPARGLWGASMGGSLVVPLLGALLYIITRPRVVIGNPNALDEAWVAPSPSAEERAKHVIV